MRCYSICCVVAVVTGLAGIVRAAELEAKGYRLTPIGLLPAPYNQAGFAVAVNNSGRVLVDSGQQPNIRAAIFTPGTAR